MYSAVPFFERHKIILEPNATYIKIINLWDVYPNAIDPIRFSIQAQLFKVNEPDEDPTGTLVMSCEHSNDRNLDDWWITTPGITMTIDNTNQLIDFTGRILTAKFYKFTFLYLGTKRARCHAIPFFF